MRVRCDPHPPREGPTTINLLDGCWAFELLVIHNLWIIDHRLPSNPTFCAAVRLLTATILLKAMYSSFKGTTSAGSTNSLCRRHP